MSGILAATRSLAGRFAASSRGNVAMIFALTLPILVMITMGGVDINRAATVKANLQDALDAAALAAARSPAVSDADLTTIGTKALRANLANYPNITLASATFSLNADQVVISNATVNVKTLVANIVLPPYGRLLDDTLPVGAHSEVNRSSKNIEVGLVLDITGSMAGQRIIDLRAAATQLVDIVVQATQTPYYTRMAIIPYSIGVNMGSYADGARGAATGSRSITGASWAKAAGVGINGITRASPGVVTTASAHGLVTGDYVWISGVSGMTQVNNRAYRAVRITNTTFSMQSWNGSSWVAVNTTSGNGYSAYSSGSSDMARECQLSDCTVVITANAHGIPATTTDTGSTQPGTVYITGVNGMTQINNQSFEVANVTTNTYSLKGVVGPYLSAYTSGGASWCGQDGCQYRVFRRWSDNALTAVETTSCISERTGAQAYTDASPATAKVGRNYAASFNPCPTATIQPLTSSISTLKTKISGLTETGSTAGQIGLAWGWYTVSPNFNTLWSSNPAGAYDPTDTLKAVILMTDGDFNSPYCTGVLARNAGDPGTGYAEDKINCDATNGDPFTQATQLCTAMKAQNIVVYTVGFQVTPNSNAANILASCATGPDYAFLPASGSDLSDDFAAIGRDITRLRISK
ncbi:ubiquitin-activating E1 FCCH domain-containing protein [Brevundimonas sp.]|uniref:ubiquitin-activating E1 FCCH domain-containing protein n=1 Tax=Brevundimonas sp. TaxID=1871086 RepID=UPI0037849249